MVLKVKCCQYLLLKTVSPSTDDCCSTVYTYSSVFSLTGVYILARAGDKVDMCRDPCLYVRYTTLVSENIIHNMRLFPRVGDPDYTLQCFQDLTSQASASCDYHRQGGICDPISTHPLGWSVVKHNKCYKMS